MADESQPCLRRHLHLHTLQHDDRLPDLDALTLVCAPRPRHSTWMPTARVPSRTGAGTAVSRYIDVVGRLPAPRRSLKTAPGRPCSDVSTGSGTTNATCIRTPCKRIHGVAKRRTASRCPGRSEVGRERRDAADACRCKCRCVPPLQCTYAWNLADFPESSDIDSELRPPPVRPPSSV